MIQCIILLLIACSVQGNSPLTPGARIVGGKGTNIEDYPHMVSLQEPLKNGGEHHFCGASIIGPLWVITAGHCVHKRNKSKITVVAGTTRKSAHGDRYKVDKIIVYPDFNAKDTLTNDIALLRTATVIHFSNKVQPINLPSSDTFGGEDLVVTGWGHFKKHGHGADKLQKLIVESLSVQDCIRKFDEKSKETKTKRTLAIKDTNICTFDRYGQGICQGDSGGSLIRGRELVGVVSFNVPCAAGFPDVYTRVYSYLGWIMRTIMENNLTSLELFMSHFFQSIGNE